MKRNFLKKLSPIQKKLRRRILEISHEKHTSHLGSCLSVVDIIWAVYAIKKQNEKFILSSGHGAVALYAVLEKKGYINHASLNTLHIHPDRNEKIGICVSSGSLGQGLPIAVGMALAKPKNKVFCVITDGECAEGSIWEAIRIASEKKLNNLTIVVNANGFGAYGALENKQLLSRFNAFGAKVSSVVGDDIEELKKTLKRKSKQRPQVIIAKTTVEQLPFLNGLDAHYKIMSPAEYTSALQILQ